MNDATLLLRQVHPQFVRHGRATSQAFTPRSRDGNRLSVYDGDRIAPAAAWRHYTAEQSLESAGVMALTVAECAEVDLPARPDPDPFPEHAVIDFGGRGAGAIRRAAWMKYSSVENGAFRQQINTARIFGLTTLSRKVITLTALGYRVVDPEQAQVARVDAFLTVPLYNKIFQEYQGKTLPPSVKGMESVLGRMGVAQKQTDKARQAFQRSAQQAGFFDAGTDRLVKPSLVSPGSFEATERGTDHAESASATDTTSVGDESTGARHPLIQGLIVTLPPPDSVWSDTERKEWLTAAEHIFALIYTAERPALPPPSEPSPVEQATD